ncbi:MAG: histidine phosphatase family protein [Betaproteobacteria bacterium]|nr:histidine phosphatase family protein [Betaproteobacteria bacterium]
MVRHGETAWNAEGRVQGQTDVPLSAVGEAQARAVRDALAGERFVALYASDLARVRQTAAPAAAVLGLPVRLEPRLRERHYGKFETLTYAEARERLPQDYARFKAKDPDYDFGSGESLRVFYERAVACVAGIAARHAGEAVLVFTHGGVLEMVRRRTHGTGLTSPRDFEIPNAALNWIDIGPAGWRVGSWAEVGHLERALDDLPD